MLSRTGASRYRTSSALLGRAREVIPGGVHLAGGRPLLEGASPLYFRRAQGSHVWDADGNEYVDFIIAYGPFVLGYAKAEVDAAAIAQIQNGPLVSLNHPLHVEFIERLLTRFPWAEMGAFFKAGSEATAAALRIARRATGRRIVARCGYHGWHDWCIPDADCVPGGLDEQVLPYDALHPQTLDAVFDQHRGEVAAVILAPEMIHPPNREALVALIDAAHRHGALFVMDEVKTGVRAPGGSMQAYYGVEADLTTLSKALGNGWPIAAVLGRRDVMQNADSMLISATYHGDTAAMAAALATLDIVDREDAATSLDRLGRRFIDGLNAAARRHGVPAVAYGEPIPAMPFLAFTHPDDAKNVRLRAHVYRHALDNGILLHPTHLWYVSTAHTDAEIDRAIEVMEEAFERAMRSADGEDA